MSPDEYRRIGVAVLGSERAYDLYGQLLAAAQAFGQVSDARPGDNTLDHAAAMCRKLNAAWLAELERQIGVRPDERPQP